MVSEDSILDIWFVDESSKQTLNKLFDSRGVNTIVDNDRDVVKLFFGLVRTFV